MSNINKDNTIVDGQIDYGRVFLTFIEHTEQKITHGLVFESLLRAFKDRGVVLKDGAATALVDLGCGEGHTACEMIDAINRVHPEGDGVSYHGLDADERFVRSTQQLLRDMQSALRLRVIDLRRADIFDAQPLPFPSINDALATLGHVLYYAYSPRGADATRNRIAGVIDRIMAVLGNDGLAILVHNADNCPLAGLRASVADCVEAKPSRIVADVATEKRLVLRSLLVPFRLCFPHLTEEQWDRTKHPADYRAESHNDSRFLATLELLTFIAQRGLQGLAQEARLTPFVAALKGALDADGVLHGWSDYQLLLSQRQSAGFEQSVEAAVRQCGQSLDQIVSQARRAFQLQVSERGRVSAPVNGYCTDTSTRRLRNPAQKKIGAYATPFKKIGADATALEILTKIDFA